MPALVAPLAPRRAPMALPLAVLLCGTAAAAVSLGSPEAQASTAAPPAAQAAPCDSTGANARALLKLEDEWAKALVRRDGATFRRILAPGFVYSENDRTMGRDVVLKEVVSGADTVEAAHNEDLCVRRFGTATAAITGWLVVRGRNANGRFDRRYRFTDTWVRQGSRWQIVAAHDYLAP